MSISVVLAGIAYKNLSKLYRGPRMDVGHVLRASVLHVHRPKSTKRVMCNKDAMLGGGHLK